MLKCLEEILTLNFLSIWSRNFQGAILRLNKNLARGRYISLETQGVYISYRNIEYMIKIYDKNEIIKKNSDTFGRWRVPKIDSNEGGYYNCLPHIFSFRQNFLKGGGPLQKILSCPLISSSVLFQWIKHSYT